MNIKTFKIKNRKGYAAVCANHLTEGKTAAEARDRMDKALRRKIVNCALTALQSDVDGGTIFVPDATFTSG